MVKFTVFRQDGCSYCQRAEQFLDALAEQAALEVNYVGPDSPKFRAAMQRLRASTVPQILVDGHHIGGWDQLSSWAARGDLDHYLATGEFRRTKRKGLLSRLLSKQ